MLGNIHSACSSLLFFRMGASFLDEQVPSAASISGKFFSYLFVFLLEFYSERVFSVSLFCLNALSTWRSAYEKYLPERKSNPNRLV